MSGLAASGEGHGGEVEAEVGGRVHAQGRDDARRVAEFCAPLGRCMVQVIPYNPGSHPLTRAPEDHETDAFIGWLRDEGLIVRRRITKGRSVMAACGQLGDPALRAEVGE